MNQAHFIGNLVRDPEMKVTANTGTPICTFTVAVNRPKDKDGQSKADYLPVKAFSGRAESCYKYLRKGSKVAVQGPVQTYTYEAQDGSKRYGFEILATEVTFLPSAHSNHAEDSDPVHQSQPQSGAPEGFQPVEADDLPF